MESLEKLKGELEPFQSDIDFLVKDVIRTEVSENKYKYFEACVFKVKALYYIRQKIDELDSKYKAYLNLCISNDTIHALEFLSKKEWDENYKLYYPFYEAIEFENLLVQGKSCLDCFSKAIGSFFNESLNNIDALIKVLKNNHLNPAVKKVLNFIEETERLNGIVIDPKGNNKKSIRDLITHREHVDIFFYYSQGRRFSKICSK